MLRRSLFLSLAFGTLGLSLGSAQAQTISMSVLPQIGAGLQVGAYAVTLSTSQHGGVTLHVETSDPAIALISNAAASPGVTFVDVFVPNGSNSISIWVHALEDTTGTATISASAPGFTGTSRPAVVVTPALEVTGLFASIDTLDPADVFAVRVGLPNAGGAFVNTAQNVRVGGSLTATITNSNAPVAQLITTPVTGQSVTVTIAAGSSQSPASVATGGVSFDGLTVGSTSVSASIPGFTATTNATQLVTVTQPVLTISPIGNVGAGLMTNANASLSAAQHGGVTVHLVSSNPAAILLSPNNTTPGDTTMDVFVANGSTSVSFVVHGLENIVSASDVSASAPGFTGATRQSLVVQPALDILGLASTLDTLDPADPFQIRIGIPNASNGIVTTPQSLRAGGPGAVATIASLTPSVGTLVTTAATDDTVMVTIAAGASFSPSTVGTGGVAFDGLAAGSSLVFAQIPGFISTTAAAQNVTVTQPTISMPAINNVGAGLMGSGQLATLSASQHGGVTMRVESLDSTTALVSPNLTTPGQRFFDVFVANGSVNVSFTIHGVEGTAGTPTILASAPGFGSASRPVTIAQPALDIISLATSIDTIDPNDPFTIRVGLPGTTNITTPQAVRAGSPGFDATIVSSNSAVGDLVTTPLTNDTVTVHIAAGNSLSPSSVAAGGVAFHPISGGATTVAASIPGFLTIAGSSVSMTVTQPTIAVGQISNVGSGLVVASSSATLSASQHGGITVRVESSNPSIALVSTNATTIGTAFFTTNLANGVTNVPVSVHGLEGATGTTSIVVTALGFADGSAPVTVVQPAVGIVNLAASMDVDDPDDPFTLRIGLSDVGGSQVTLPQPLRPGSAGIVATLVSSNSAVGDLVTTALTGDTVIVSMAAGSSTTPGTVAAGGVAFRGLAVGNTLVSARIDGFFPTGSATHSIDVTDQAVTMTPIGKVGAGLQSAAIAAAIGLSQHGGVTVRVASSDANITRVSPDFATPGSAFLDIVLPNGTANFSFFVHGMEDTVAAATITASTPGFASAVRTVDVVQAGVQIEQLADSIDVNLPPDPFIVRVGVPKSDLSEIETSQVIRAGGMPMVATVTSSNTAAGVLNTSSESGASVSVTIPVGQSQCASDVASGGVELDPILAGTTTVSAAIAGVATLQSSAFDCVMTGVPDPTPVPAIPNELTLAQNHPNPFNPTTRIRFALPAASHVNVSVFDVRGRHVTTLVDKPMPAGTAEVSWNGRDAHGVAASSGVYFYKLSTNERSLTKKMVLIK